MATQSAQKKAGRRKKKLKPIKYKPVCFKLTVGQKKALERYCKDHHLTPVRFMKALVNDHVARYRDKAPPPSYVTKNQLKLFDQSEE